MQNSTEDSDSYGVTRGEEIEKDSNYDVTD